MATIQPPPYIVWSTDRVDLTDPFQRRWYLRQVLIHGRSEDIHTLDLVEIQHELENLNLTKDVLSLWRSFFAKRHDEG